LLKVALNTLTLNKHCQKTYKNGSSYNINTIFKLPYFIAVNMGASSVKVIEIIKGIITKQK